MAARLGQGKALEIKALLASGSYRSFSEIARVAGASVATVSRIARGAQWADVPLVDAPLAAPESYSARLRGRDGRRCIRGRRSRLSSEQVRRIKQRVLAGESFRSIAAEHDIDFGYVGRIARGESLAHISPSDGVDPGPVHRGQRRLATEEVSAIRERKDVSAAELAREFGVHSSTVRRVRAGQSWSGDGRAATKLTAASARELRDRLERGESVKKLAAEYGVGQTTVRNVQSGHSWR